MPIIGLFFFFVLILYAYHHGIFRSSTSLQAFIQQFGKYAVMIFVLLQVIQVIIPILPGGISSVAGMLICLVAGLTKLSFREFMQIVIFLKPWSVGVYSMIMLFLFHQAQGHL